jgi:hypothetical protein
VTSSPRPGATARTRSGLPRAATTRAPRRCDLDRSARSGARARRQQLFANAQPPGA